MKELYFINLIGNLQTAAVVLCAITGGFLLIGLSFLLVVLDDLDVEEEKRKQISRKSAISCAITFVLSVILIVFLPSKKDMYIIYGVGKTMDWVKGNDKAEQLPDKAVKALDAFLDDYCKEKNK